MLVPYYIVSLMRQVTSLPAHHSCSCVISIEITSVDVDVKVPSYLIQCRVGKKDADSSSFIVNNRSFMAAPATSCRVCILHNSVLIYAWVVKVKYSKKTAVSGSRKLIHKSTCIIFMTVSQ